MRAWRLAFAFLVLAALTWSAGTGCVPVEASELQMSCCHSGPSDATIVKTTAITKPTVVAICVLPSLELSLRASGPRPVLSNVPGVVPLSPPPYIEYSALLI